MPPLVYSTEQGRMCPRCRQPVAACKCKQKSASLPTDGVVRVRRETKGRGGKTVTTVTGVPLAEAALRELAGELKRCCGTGGAVKEGVIIIQGDQCAAVIALLKERGYFVKQAGG